MIQTRPVNVERWSVTSTESFETILARMEGEIGRPEMSAFWQKAASAGTLPASSARERCGSIRGPGRDHAGARGGALEGRQRLDRCGREGAAAQHKILMNEARSSIVIRYR